MPQTIVYGLKIHYTDSHPSEHPDTPVIMFVHGWCSDHTTFDSQISHFKNNYRCITLDLPGFGKSAKPKVDYTFIIYGEVLNQFCQQLNIKHPILIGHSLGGLIALEMSWQKPDLPQKIILLDSAPIIKSKEIRQNMRYSLDNIYEFGAVHQIEKLMEILLFRQEDSQDLKNKTIKTAQLADKDAAIAIWKHMLDYDGKRALKSAIAPIYYISSSIFQNNPKMLKQYQPNMHWAQVMNGFHMCHESEYQQVNAMINACLNDSN